MTDKIPIAEDFQNELDQIFHENETNGKVFVDVRAGDLHTRVGHYPEPDHRMPVCCRVMRKNIQKEVGDTELPGGPQKGDGASLIIRYMLPREKIGQVQNVRKEDSRLVNYSNVTIISGSRQCTTDSWDCPVCQGEGVIHDPFLPDKQCPACQGEGHWKANIQIDRLLTCNRCKGKGTIELDRTLPLGRDVCPICKGSGKRPPGSGKKLT